MPDLSLNPDIGTQRAPRVSPYPDASLYLDFLTMSANFMDSRITFSRGTNATLTDSTGRITYAPANLLLRSQEFDNVASWTLEGSTLSGGRTAPDGTATAYLFTATAPSGNRRITQVITQAIGVNYIRSIWIRRVTGTGTILLRNPTGGDTDITSQISSTWSRIAVTGNATGASNFILAFSVTGDALEIWGAQVEPVTYQTTPSTYVATTSAAYYGPRFDYDPVTLAPKGLLIEEQRTNLLTYSDALDNTTGWPTATNVTVTANVTASPDGTVNADRLDDGTTAAVQHRLFRSYTFTAAAHTLSIYAKAGTGAWFQLIVNDGTTSFYANFNASTGATGSRHASATSTITNVGNGWYRCTMTATTLAAVGNVQIGMLDTDQGVAVPSYTGANRTLFFYGAQLEAGAFATSYIPTVASTVTRNADVATMTGTNFSSWYNQSEGTFVAEFQTVALRAGGAAGHRVAVANDGSNSNVVYLYTYAAIAGGQVVTGGVTQADINGGGSPANNTTIKSAIAYATNNVAVTVNGATPTTDTSVTIPTVNQLGLGSQQSASQLNGHIRTIAYFNTRQPNAKLQTLTT